MWPKVEKSLTFIYIYIYKSCILFNELNQHKRKIMIKRFRKL